MKVAASSLLAIQVGSALAATATQWQDRIIYQVMTDRFARPDGSTTAPCNLEDQQYCGGTWQGIIQKLDYIQGMGFSAVWISPVTKQIENKNGPTGFHGYYQTDLYSLNSHFGTAEDLKALSAALHSRGMYLMVDVVVNHFAWAGDHESVDYSSYKPFNEPKYFHPFCTIQQSDYSSNQTAVENCWPAENLTDLDTTRQDVKTAYYSWIGKLVSNYSIDGIRIDTVKHVQKDFWSGFNSAAGVYCVGEVFDSSPDYVCPYQEVMDGLLNYPLFDSVTAAFKSTSGSMPDLAKAVDSIKSSCKNSTLLAPFLENHDNPRFPSLTPDLALNQNAIAFTLLSDGMPIVYQGQEQHFDGQNDPYDREALWTSGYATSQAPLYSFITTINKVRTAAIKKDPSFVDHQAQSIYSDTTTIAMRKGDDGGQIIGVFSNKGASGDGYTQSISKTGFTAGEDVTEVLSCVGITAAADGSISVDMGKGAAKIFVATANLADSGLCTS